MTDMSLTPAATRPRRLLRARGRRVAAGLAVVVTVVAGASALHTVEASAAPAPGSFSTSFEATDPAAVATTVENRSDGTPMRHGIEASSNRLPGSVIDPSTPISASAEN